MVEQQAILLDNIFHALADPTRREMLRLLALQERTVTELAAPFQMSLAAASKHIKVLEDAGLLSRTIQGRTHICRLNAATLAAARRWFGFYEHFGGEQLDALERKVSKAGTETQEKQTKKKKQGKKKKLTKKKSGEA